MFMMFLMQVEAAAEVGVEVVKGKSEVFIAAVILVAGILWVMFQQQKDRKESAERHAEREKEMAALQAKRDEEDKKRYDEQNQFHRDMALRNADQLDAMSASLDRTSRATEIMAKCADNTETALLELGKAQRRDRRAIISVIDASEAKARGEDDLASIAIKEARNHLIGDDRK
jgi:hypothetical protein